MSYTYPYAQRPDSMPDPRDIMMQRAGMAQAAQQRTAIMDLDAFLAGLSADERADVLNNPAFARMNAEFMQGFVAFLLAGEPGRAYINAGAKEPAERLLMVAKDVHGKRKEESRNEVEKLKQELGALKRKLGEEDVNHE